jgi:LysM repeat protein
MSVPQLKRLNDMVSDDLYPGQILKVMVEPDCPALKMREYDSLLALHQEMLKNTTWKGSHNASDHTSKEGSSEWELMKNPKESTSPDTDSSIENNLSHNLTNKISAQNNASIKAEDLGDSGITHEDIQSQFDSIQSK